LFPGGVVAAPFAAKCWFGPKRPAAFSATPFWPARQVSRGFAAARGPRPADGVKHPDKVVFAPQKTAGYAHLHFILEGCVLFCIQFFE